MPKIQISGRFDLGTQKERVALILKGLSQGWGELRKSQRVEGGDLFILITQSNGVLEILKEDVEFMIEEGYIEGEFTQ